MIGGCFYIAQCYNTDLPKRKGTTMNSWKKIAEVAVGTKYYVGHDKNMTPRLKRLCDHKVVATKLSEAKRIIKQA